MHGRGRRRGRLPSVDPFDATTVRAAYETVADDYAADGWPTQTLVSVLRSLVVDVLQIAGMSASEARDQLPDADGKVAAWGAEDEDTSAEEDDDEGSAPAGGAGA